MSPVATVAALAVGYLVVGGLTVRADDRLNDEVDADAWMVALFWPFIWAWWAFVAAFLAFLWTASLITGRRHL